MLTVLSRGIKAVHRDSSSRSESIQSAQTILPEFFLIEIKEGEVSNRPKTEQWFHVELWDSVKKNGLLTV